MEVSRYVGFTFLTGFVLLFITMMKVVEMVWEMAETLPKIAIIGSQITLTTLIALVLSAGISYWAYQRDDYRTYIAEVVIELQKVTWPDWDQLRSATLVVLAFTIAVSAIIWLMDKAASWVIGLIMGIFGA